MFNQDLTSKKKKDLLEDLAVEAFVVTIEVLLVVVEDKEENSEEVVETDPFLKGDILTLTSHLLLEVEKEDAVEDLLKENLQIDLTAEPLEVVWIKPTLRVE